MVTRKVLIGDSSPMTASHAQLMELHRQLEGGSLNSRHLQTFLRHKDPFGFSDVKIDWKRVYELLGTRVDFDEEDLEVHEHWVVPVFNGVTPDKVVQTMRDLGVGVSLHINDLDKNVPMNDRNPAKDGDYRIKCLKSLEADFELQSKSAEMLSEEKIQGITLLERLLLGLGYFVTTGNHLDVGNITLCSGSRYYNGIVPTVYWDSDDHVVVVYYCILTGSNFNLRARAVIP